MLFFKKEKKPPLLHKKGWIEKHELEVTILLGILLILLLFIFSFACVGQMDPYTNGVLA